MTIINPINLFAAPINLLISFINSLETISIAGFGEYIAIIYDVLSVVCYLIPVYALIPLIKLSLAIVAFKIVLAIIRLVIDLVPLW